MLADLALIDLADLAYLPFNSAARQLVFSETGRGVHTVLVDGQTVLMNGRLTLVDESSFRQELADVMEGVSTATIVNWPRGNVQPFPTCSKQTEISRRRSSVSAGFMGDSQE